MTFNRLGAFTLGVIIATVSVGAVSFANAAGDANIKACANKKTGAMRYIAKGKCKKTEKALRWNQMGLTGATGINGATGAKGDTGANGQNFHLIDAAGHDLGPALGLWNSGQNATLIHEGGLWEITSYSNFLNGAIGSPRFYSDSSCNSPVAEVNEKMQIMSRGWDGNEKNPRYWKLSGDQFRFSSTVVYGKVQTGPFLTSRCYARHPQTLLFTDSFLREPDRILFFPRLSKSLHRHPQPRSRLSLNEICV